MTRSCGCQDTSETVGVEEGGGVGEAGAVGVVVQRSDARLLPAAVPPGLVDGVAHAAVGQPACVAAVVALQLPGCEHLSHLGNLSAILPARLHGFIVRQLLWVYQVVESPLWE